MDSVGLYREDEQFSFSTSSYMESYSSDSTHFDTMHALGQSEFFEEIRHMSHPPNDIFEWNNDTDTEAKDNLTDTTSLSNVDNMDEILEFSSPANENLREIINLELWPSASNVTVQTMQTQHTSVSDKVNKDKQTNRSLQEILEVPDIVSTLNTQSYNFAQIKIEPEFDSSISKKTDAECNLSRNRLTSESSDILNTSFSSTDINNFDIAEYVFEENKQSKQSMKIKNEVNIENNPVINESIHRDVKPEIPKRTVRAGMKKIDLEKQRYIIEESDIKKSFSEDECDVDIETVSEEESVPVLEAKDLSSLLEQFEATEVKSKSTNIKSQTKSCHNLNVNIEAEIKFEKDPQENLKKKVIKKEPTYNTIKKEPICNSVKKESVNKNIKKEPVCNTLKEPVNSNTKKELVCSSIKKEPINKQVIKLLPSDSKLNGVKVVQVKKEKSWEPEKEKKGAIEQCITKPEPPLKKEQLYINNKLMITKQDAIVRSEETTSSKVVPHNMSSNKQILEALPQDLINRIKESGKRKPVTVIQPMPNPRKVKPNKTQESRGSISNTIHLDHNYCSPRSQIALKDSGFASSEEDDRTIISRQPTVKNADGTLMVSLLKANTIHQVESLKMQKKKLNLEEYKKRRNGLLTPNGSSQNCSPNTSTCSSPLPEDDHQKMLKHQEKLRKMAEEVLNAAPKSEKKEPVKAPTLIPLSPVASPKMSSKPTSPFISTVKTDEPTKLPTADKEVLNAPKIPDNLERKILVSFGVNTDFKIAKNEDPLAPVQKLEEIKPLLQKASDKIGENSLIVSVIETIPKLIEKTKKSENSRTTVPNMEEYEHGENKQVLHLEKDRVRCETKDVEVQTDISLIEQTKRGRIRRRHSSSSSCSSYKSKESLSSKRSRKCSDSSSSSRSSTSSRSSRTSQSSSSSSRSSCSSSRSSRCSSRLSYRSRSRSRSPLYDRRYRSGSAEREYLNSVEERRIIYVGRIATGTSKEELRKKFQKFGPINKISLHFRDIGENYGFVTFKYKEDAHEAYEHGNDDPAFPCYKISFGGRREFCQAAYSDLDNMRDDSYFQGQGKEDSYDRLLKEAMEKLKKRKA